MSLLEGTVVQRDPEALRVYLSAPAPTNRFSTGLVAEIDGQVVGVVAGIGLRIELPGLSVSSEEIAKRVGLLDVVAVHPDHRREGLGTLLCHSLLDRFRKTGQRLMVAQLAAGRHELIPVYARWGGLWGYRGQGSVLSWVRIRSRSRRIRHVVRPGHRSCRECA
ncbi:GNAT family N-acetyltransferase [Streptomyces poriferorum]|uniref:GNAT family N-acetyltransferase n=1 Tax=Streptomyces poriferorum TaxID=2798799 RepID=UPI003531B8F3